MKTTCRMRRNIYDATDKGLIFKIYKQLIKLNNNNKSKQPYAKMGRRPKSIFLQRRHTNGQEAHEKLLNITNNSVQFSSVAQSCPTLCDPMNRSTPGLLVHHQLPKFTQTHAHRVDDAIQPSHPLLSPSLPTFNICPLLLLLLRRFSRVRLCATPETAAHRPWDSPGKNTGVGCHFLLQCMKVKSESEVTQIAKSLHDPVDCNLQGSSIHGILQARVLEWGAIAYSVILPRNENNFTYSIQFGFLLFFI